MGQPVRQQPPAGRYPPDLPPTSIPRG